MSRTDWRSAALVLALHLLIAWALHMLMRRPSLPPANGPSLQWIDLPRLTEPAPSPRATAAPRLASRPAPARPLTPPAETAPTELRLVEAPATPQAVEPPASAASSPRSRLLDTAASRQALRQLGGQALLSERAAQAMGTEIERSDTALARDVQSSQRGDCLKGEYAGAGMGLLSLPALAVAAARGQCAR